MFIVFVCLCLQATGLHAFSATTSALHVTVKENSGADLKCDYSADFGSLPRVEWKFQNYKGSQSLIYYDGQITAPYKVRFSQYPGGLRIEKTVRTDTGDYSCEVSGNGGYAEITIKLTVLVPPSVPISRIPTSVTTGQNVLLTCFDKEGSPPCTYKWYKDNTPLPEDPTKFPNFQNMTYKMNAQNGNLEFPSVSKAATGNYFCEASNGQGPAQRGQAVLMEVRDVNTGGIVAGIIVALLAIALLCFGLWYANKKGYLPKIPKSQTKKSVYTQPRAEYTDNDGEFRQKSSFVV
ncbi:F11 receptor, tandem duplicate 1 [Electrophorus electricus]|uniref:F11 receptor, tandem duplicate 1 n=1 Tax=Electrophorus electricus TaxID=8005 RepID=UPI0015CFF073|nr:F11 receptor, tandem duplicate 1 [Electrophorus electricus]XP_026854310.2 F11 receptor, tandem duplicate 1 [Electrophorus electricus]